MAPTATGYPALQVALDGRSGARLINTNYLNFAPRFGIAWSPSTKWVVRSGFGIFYSQESKNSIFDLNGGLGGRTGQVTQTTYGLPTITYQNFINTSALPVTIPLRLTWGTDQNLPTTYSMQYLRHLNSLINQNAPIPGTAPVLSRLPFPEFAAAGIQYLRADGVGNYNGLGDKRSGE